MKYSFYYYVVHACVLSNFSCVPLFVTPWTVARQAPLSVGLSRQESWCGLPFPSPGKLPDPGIKPTSLLSPALIGMFFTPSATREAHYFVVTLPNFSNFFSLKVNFAAIGKDTPAFYWLVLVWYIFFHPFTFNILSLCSSVSFE